MLEFLWKLLGLVGKLDEYGEGYEPSPFSKMLAIDSKTDYKPIDFGKKYTGSKKILVICTEERYMIMENGKKFSSGNHPVETVQPLMHLKNAGFDFEVATPTGKPACLEMWAMPTKDEEFLTFFETHAEPKCKNPKSLAELVDKGKLDDYVGFFAPGGQGAMLGLPEDINMGKVVTYAKEKDILLMSVCHGPAAFLAAPKEKDHPFKGYKVACFPDAVDKQTPMIGYLPGKQTWYFGEKLVERGIEIVNTQPDGTVSFDRKLLTGASPKACQEMGKVAAESLLAEYVK